MNDPTISPTPARNKRAAIRRVTNTGTPAAKKITFAPATASPNAIRKLLSTDTSPAASPTQVPSAKGDKGPSRSDADVQQKLLSVENRVDEGEVGVRKAFVKTNTAIEGVKAELKKHVDDNKRQVQAEIQDVKSDVADVQQKVQEHEDLHEKSTISHIDHYEGLKDLRSDVQSLRKKVTETSSAGIDDLKRRVQQLSGTLEEALTDMQVEGRETRRAVSVMLKADKALVSFGRSLALLQKRVEALEQRK